MSADGMAWSSGDRLIVRGTDWRVTRSTAFSDCEALDLANAHADTALTVLLPFDRPRTPSPPRFQAVSRTRWAREVSAALCTIHPYGGLNFCTTRIQLWPYQLEPALAVLRHGAVRVLIADDPGLGKTIEAGLIVREMALRDRFSRILILSPASIRGQWHDELSSLFDLAAVDADAAWLRRSATELPPDVNPWSLPGVYLASLDFVKRAEALRPLEDVRWDLLVVDEAHAATPASDRCAAVRALAERTRVLVLLTATPHSGDDRQFAALCATGAARGSPPMVLFNRTRAETPLGRRPARSCLLAIRQTAAERRMHRLLDDYTQRIWAESRDRRDTDGQLVATILRKRALSSPVSLARSLRRRLALLSDSVPREPQLALPLEDDEPIEEDAAPDGPLGRAPLRDPDEERRILTMAAEQSEAVGVNDSKLRALVRLLRRVREPALVFTEYRDTAEHLARSLVEYGHAVCVLHGGMSARDRSTATARFRSGGHLLVATDAASEGLNLHHACRLVIHFELPWTPLRLHQRRGRVDRIGQTRRVHEIAFIANDTCEMLVLAPLVRRAIRSGHFAASPLVELFSESRVAAHVLANAPLAASAAGSLRTHRWLQTLDLRQEAADEVERLEQLRRLQRPQQTADTEPRTRAVIPVAVDRKRRPLFRKGLALVLRVTLRDRSGIRSGQYPVVVLVDLRHDGWERQGARLCRQVAGLLGEIEPHVHRVAESRLAGTVAAVSRARATAIESIRKRDAHMQHQLQSTARTLVQPGLFDRRALRASAARERSRVGVLEDLQTRSPAPAAEPVLEPVCDVIAVLVGGRT